MMKTGFRAMGTNMVLYGPDQARLSEAHDWIWRTEQRCSRFIETSELCNINADPSSSVTVSEELASVLAVAQEMRRRTSGLVDIGLGRTVAAWGYDRDFTEVKDQMSTPAATPASDWELSDTTLTRTGQPHLDLGGIAKGWACDQLVESDLVSVASAGGDLRSADTETTVLLVDPWGDEAAEVALGVGALATSSVTRKRWNVGRGEAHHLIDPRSMAPSTTPVASATVVAKTSAEAEAGAKAVLLHGAEGLDWADDQTWIDGAVAIWADGNVYATSSMKERLR